MKRHVVSPVADVRGAPDAAALRGKNETQLVRGELFLVEEEKDGWCRGSCAHDGYTGYVESLHLSKTAITLTHVVTAVRSHVYRDASMKSPLLETLGFGSRVTAEQEQDGFARLAGGGWIYQKHLSPAAMTDGNFVASARKFLETPYFWGGRSGFGIDCSGLVQVCLGRAGIAVPRDTEEQEKAIGTAITETPRRGDIVFFPGHVGIMADEANILHANAFHMKVTLEPLNEVAARGKGISAVRRILP